MEILHQFILLALSSFIIWKVCDSFQLASMFLGKKMPAGTRGATINAIGSSFPEFMTSFIAIFQYSDKDGAIFGIANTTGSVIFNVTIIPFCVILSSYFFGNLKKMKFKRYIIFRDGFFLIFTQMMLMLILTKGRVSIVDSLFLVFIYLFYLIVIFNYPKQSLGKEIEEEVEGETTHYVKCISKGIVHAVCDLDLFAIFFRKHKKQTHKISIIVLLLSILIFYFMCDILVASSYRLGEILDIPSYFIALTVTAIATSIPDTVLSVKDAKIGEFDDAITNAFGSNIFNISFCIGFPILIYNLINGTDIVFDMVSIENINALKNLSIFLIFLVVFIFITKEKRWILKAFMLFAIYIVFLFNTLHEVQVSKTKDLNDKLLPVSKNINY